MMGAGGDELEVRGLGVEPYDPVGHHLGVGLLLRPLDAVDDDALRIVGVGRVDRGDGPGQAIVGTGRAGTRRDAQREPA
jgi:hypothetical protein